MTSTAPVQTPTTQTNSAITNATSHQRTTSSSGQTSSSAAVTANAPAPRQGSLSYATVVNQKKLPTGPGSAASGTPGAQVPSATSSQHARSASTASVNGRIQPAVPQIGSTGSNVSNGASSAPFSGGQHSRKSSLASGNMPNGSRAASLKFGEISEPRMSQASSGPAVAAGSSLTAPVAPNPRSSSPHNSPSPAPQPVASGGAPPQPSSARPIQFGDAAQHPTRPTSMPPLGPGGSAQIHGPNHGRRDSTHSAHGESPNMPHGRGMPPAGRGRQPYTNSSFQNQPYGYNAGRGYTGGPNQPRNGPGNMGGPANYPQAFPNSPRHVHRSPALAHASPSMSTVVPATPQLYPPQPSGPYLQGAPHYPPQVYADPSYHYGQYNMGYQAYPQTSPRPAYQQVAPPVAPQYQPYPPPQAVSMSRSSSANVAEMHRPASSIGHHPTPSMTPQPQNIVSPPQPGTPGPPPASPYGPNRTKRAPSKAIEIKNPDTGATVKPEKPAPSPATPTPATTGSPSPAPGRTASRDGAEVRSASQGKNPEEKRLAMKEAVRRNLEQKKAEQEQERRRKEEEAKAEEERKAKEEAEAAERKRKEEEEERLKKEAEEKAKAEAEEKAKREAEENAKREAEEKARIEAEKVREEERKRAEEEARVAKEKAEKEAREREEREAKEREAKERAEKLRAEEEAKKAEEAKAGAEKSAITTPVTTPDLSSKVSTPDSEAMPPPTKPAERSKAKPSPLNLQIKTNEQPLPSAALTALRSARPIDNLRHLQYPEGIQSPNPALNPLATGTKFKYDKEFLMQFQNVFTEKPSMDWDQKMRETVGDSESARPGTARTPSGMGPRSTSRSGPSNMQPPMGSMGGMGAFGSFGSSGISSSRFGQKPTGGASNPLAHMVTGFGRQGSGLVRTNSSTSLSGSSGGVPQSPRTGNKSSRGSSRRGGAGAGAGGAPMERNESRSGGTGPTIPLADVKPLEVSGNRWKPTSVGRRTAEAPAVAVAAATAATAAAAAAVESDNRLSPDMVQRKVKAALNKMTPEKFDKIADQILEITSQSKFESDGRTLRQVIQLTFEKATDEAAWSSMYAKFCKKMLESMDPDIKDESIRDKNDQVVTGGNLFRKYLLNRCQEEFERGWKVNLPPKPEGVSDEAAMLSDEYYIAAAAKRRGLGLVQFIGELFKLGMLTERIMNECVRKLLDYEGIPEDETVESLAKLLRTIGSQLDQSERSKNMMNAYFTRIQQLIDNKELNSRMRFMLMDVVDLRRVNWVSKEADKGPKTIQEVREEALKQAQEKEAASRASRSGGRPQAGRGDARSFSQGFPLHGSYHDKAGATVAADDLRKLKTGQARQVSAGTTFGPQSMFAASRGSSGGSRRGLGPNSVRGDDSGPGSRTATPPAPASTSSPNPFSLLEASHAHENDAVSPPASTAGSPQVSSAKLEKVRSNNSVAGDSK